MSKTMLIDATHAEETRVVGMLSASQVRHTTDVLRSVVSATTPQRDSSSDSPGPKQIAGM